MHTLSKFWKQIAIIFFLVMPFIPETVPATNANNNKEEIIYSSKPEFKKSLPEKILYRFALVEKNKITNIEEYATENAKFSPVSAFYIFFAMFLVGFIHSFFPGSGKIYAASYFLAGDLAIGKALEYSYKAMLVHTGVTFAVYSLILFERASETLKISFFDFFNPYGRYMLVISSVLLFLLGLFLFFGKLKYALSDNPAHKAGTTPKSLYLLMIFVGISPCIIVPQLVEVTYKINLFYSLVMIMAFIAGMSVGMFGFLAVIISAKRLLLTSLGGSWEMPSPFKTTLEIAVLFFMTIMALSFAIFNLVG